MFAMMIKGMKGDALSLPEGYTWKRAGSGHYGIVCPDGHVLRTAAGIPMKVSATPSDHRARKNEWARIRKALRHRGENV